MDRKGTIGEQISIVMFLFLMIIIGIGIYIGTSIFFGNGYDFREVESGLLNYKIKECIIKNEVHEEFFEDFLERCKLNKEILQKNNIIKICKNSGDCIRAEKSEFSLGSDFQSCGFEGARENIEFVRCSINKFKKGGDEFDVIAGSKQNRRRVLG